MKDNLENLVIGQFNDAFPPIMEGVGQVVKNYAYWLNKKYGKCYVITPSVPNYNYENNLPLLKFISIPIPKTKPFRYGLPFLDFKFKKDLKKINFDIVHAHCPFVTGDLALKVAKDLKIPLVATFHTKYRQDFERLIPSKIIVDRIMKKIINFYQKADSVWAPSISTADILREYGYKNEIEIMPNATDIIPQKNLEQLKYSANSDFETSINDFVMLFIGQIRWEKNLKLIIDSIKILEDQRKEFKMIIVGEGFSEYEVRKLVDNKNLNKKVKFMGKIIDRDKISSYYARANLFLFPSLYDNSPLVVKEAAAFSLPSVLINNSSAAENIIDGENGFLSENTPISYSIKIMDLMNNPKKIIKAGEGAKNSLYHTWEPNVDKVIERYKEIILSYKKKKI